MSLMLSHDIDVEITVQDADQVLDEVRFEVARQLLDAARQIDRGFVAQLGRFPLRLEIPYARIEPLRLRRIGMPGNSLRRAE